MNLLMNRLIPYQTAVGTEGSPGNKTTNYSWSTSKPYELTLAIFFKLHNPQYIQKINKIFFKLCPANNAADLNSYK